MIKKQKQNMLKKILNKFLLGIITLSLVAPFAFASNLLMVDAIDTIAGFGTSLETNTGLPRSEVTFVLEHQNGTKELYKAFADKQGFATLDIDGKDLTKAGIYTVYAQTDNTPGPETVFTVYADEVSSDLSKVSISKKAVTLGDTSLLTVKLLDQYRNPIKGHQVTVISSRDGDLIENISKSYTNSSGETLFEVSSNNVGASSYSVFDVTSGKVLKARPQIYFSTEYSKISSAGGNFDLVAVAGDASYLAIEDVPANAPINENVSFTVTVYDDDDNIVKDYAGTVHISAVGENGKFVDLPSSDYSFEESDMGTHIYSLGLRFLKSGTYLIEARDVDDYSILGELEVVAGTGVSDSASEDISEDYEFTLVSPVSGTYKETIQTLSGKAPPGYGIGFYDNEEEFGYIEADTNGDYTFDTTPLSSGEHNFVAVLLDDKSEVIKELDPVKVIIDVAAPTVDQVEIDPLAAAPETSVNVVVHSEDNLSSVKVKLGTQTFELQADPTNPGIYKGTAEVPAEAGAYELTVALADALGNEALYENKGTVTVDPSLHGAALDAEISDEIGTAVPKVVGISTVPSGGKITLIWAPVTTINGVKNYRVYYGLAADQLTHALDTLTSDTTWYVPGLQNGMTYFFAVTAIDNQGQEGVMSDIVSAVPFGTETFQGLAQIPDGQQVPAGYYNYPYMTAQTGPEISWLLFASLLGSFFYFGFSGRFNKDRFFK